MKAFWKSVAAVLFYVISGALLVYAASRSLDFITSTLPPSQQVIGYLALAATSGGAIAWLLVFLYKSRGMGQHVTAALMTVIDLIGEIALFTMDTLLRSAENGMIATLAPKEIRTTIYALSALVGLNLVATFAFHLADPENVRRMRVGFVRDRLESETLKRIEADAEQTVPDHAAALAAQFQAQIANTYSSPESLGIAATPENGHAYQADVALTHAKPFRDYEPGEYGDPHDPNNQVYFWEDGTPRYHPAFGLKGQRYKEDPAPPAPPDPTEPPDAAEK